MTVVVEDAANNPAAAVKYAVTPIMPPLTGAVGQSAVGMGLSTELDAIISADQIIGTFDASGEASVTLVPSSDVLAADDGTRLQYRLTVGPTAEAIVTPHVTFEMPDSDSRLEDIVHESLSLVGALQKRSWSQRVFTVDLSAAIGVGNTATVAGITSIAMVDSDSGVTISNETTHDRAVSFLASGGNPGLWAVRVQVTLSGSPTERLERDVPLLITAAAG